MAPVDAAPHPLLGEESATAATEACLARIERLDPLLRAFITITRDTALEAARAADGAWREGASPGLVARHADRHQGLH